MIQSGEASTASPDCLSVITSPAVCLLGDFFLAPHFPQRASHEGPKAANADAFAFSRRLVSSIRTPLLICFFQPQTNVKQETELSAVEQRTKPSIHCMLVTEKTRLSRSVSVNAHGARMNFGFWLPVGTTRTSTCRTRASRIPAMRHAPR